MAGRGFVPVQETGRGYNGQLTPFPILKNYGTSIFNGDPVRLVADGTIQEANAVADINGGDMVGVFMGCEYVNSAGTPTWSQYYPASQNVDGIVAYVAGTDPLTRYRVKWLTAGADATDVRADTVGMNFDLDVTDAAGNTTTGNSTLGLDTATGVLGTANFRVVDLVNTDGSDSLIRAAAATTYTHAIVIVEPNLHAFTNTTGI
tara:strand:- start:378 stop:989 length:612 start_codon:yes stop_codon:yes gene_type:complete